MEQPLVAIVGPTGSGKSALAFALARALSGEIVNCDSMQVYRGLDIGTDKPSAEERAAVPHHLFDIVDPDEHFSAGDYVELAEKTIAGISGRGHLPIIVGGTGLYLRALLRGLFAGPARAVELRERLHNRARARGLDYLHKMLRRLDPESASRISPRDAVRIVRALEVYFITGKPIGRHFREQPPGLQSRYRTIIIGLEPPRRQLYERINRRSEEQFRRGLVEEVERLLARGCPPTARPLATMNYKHVLAAIEGRISYEQALALTQRDNRRYAKRQMTWFRKEPGVRWLHGFGQEPKIQEQALALIRSQAGQPSLKPEGQEP